MTDLTPLDPSPVVQPIAGSHATAGRPAAAAAALCLVLALLTALACGGGGEEPAGGTAEGSEAAAPDLTLVSVLPVEPELVADRLSLPADLLPERRAVVAAEVAGTVEVVRVEEGQRVSRGQALAAVDTRDLEQAVAEAEAFDRQAQAQLERAQNLYEKRSITQKDLLDALTNADVATARLASARLELDRSRIVAPWSGRVAAKRVEVGDYVVPGQAMFELVDVDTLKVRAPVPASDVPYLEVGAPVAIRVSSLPGEELRGRVVRLAAELDTAARTLDLEAELPNPDGRLKPGMLARVELTRRSLPDALLVPLDAVVDLERSKVVYVVEEGRASRRTVTLGPVIGDRVVIASGLEAGDRVIVRGQSQVAPGQPVEAVEARRDRLPAGSEVDGLPGAPTVLGDREEVPPAEAEGQEGGQ